MDRSSGTPRSHQVEWLDTPSLPDDATLEELREVLRQHHQIGEAWLVRNLITPAGGDAHEVTAIALNVDSATDAPSPASADLVAELSRAVNPALSVYNWIFVNDGIRAKTEQHGLKVYCRS
jgi:hypothetical protein